MTAAFLLIGMGGLMLVSSLHGTSIVETLKGTFGPLSGRKPKSSFDFNTPLAGTSGFMDPLAFVGLDSKGLPTGLKVIDGKYVAAWIYPILTYARARGWKGTVSSGYRSVADQAAVCATGVKPCAPPGQSNHQGKSFPSGAVDVTEAAALSAILLKSPYAKRLVWAGAKDPVHFSYPHNGSY